MVIHSIHEALPFSKTGFFNKFLSVQLQISTKTAPRDVYLEK